MLPQQHPTDLFFPEKLASELWLLENSLFDSSRLLSLTLFEHTFGQLAGSVQKLTLMDIVARKIENPDKNMLIRK